MKRQDIRIYRINFTMDTIRHMPIPYTPTHAGDIYGIPLTHFILVVSLYFCYTRGK